MRRSRPLADHYPLTPAAGGRGGGGGEGAQQVNRKISLSAAVHNNDSGSAQRVNMTRLSHLSSSSTRGGVAGASPQPNMPTEDASFQPPRRWGPRHSADNDNSNDDRPFYDGGSVLDLPAGRPAAAHGPSLAAAAVKERHQPPPTRSHKLSTQQHQQQRSHEPQEQQQQQQPPLRYHPRPTQFIIRQLPAATHICPSLPPRMNAAVSAEEEEEEHPRVRGPPPPQPTMRSGLPVTRLLSGSMSVVSLQPQQPPSTLSSLNLSHLWGGSGIAPPAAATAAVHPEASVRSTMSRRQQQPQQQPAPSASHDTTDEGFYGDAVFGRSESHGKRPQPRGFVTPPHRKPAAAAASTSAMNSSSNNRAGVNLDKYFSKGDVFSRSGVGGTSKHSAGAAAGRNGGHNSAVFWGFERNPSCSRGASSSESASDSSVSVDDDDHRHNQISRNRSALAAQRRPAASHNHHSTAAGEGVTVALASSSSSSPHPYDVSGRPSRGAGTAHDTIFTRNRVPESRVLQSFLALQRGGNDRNHNNVEHESKSLPSLSPSRVKHGRKANGRRNGGNNTPVEVGASLLSAHDRSQLQSVVEAAERATAAATLAASQLAAATSQVATTASSAGTAATAAVHGNNSADASAAQSIEFMSALIQSIVPGASKPAVQATGRVSGDGSATTAAAAAAAVEGKGDTTTGPCETLVGNAGDPLVLNIVVDYLKKKASRLEGQNTELWDFLHRGGPSVVGINDVSARGIKTNGNKKKRGRKDCHKGRSRSSSSTSSSSSSSSSGSSDATMVERKCRHRSHHRKAAAATAAQTVSTSRKVAAAAKIESIERTHNISSHQQQQQQQPDGAGSFHTPQRSHRQHQHQQQHHQSPQNRTPSPRGDRGATPLMSPSRISSSSSSSDSGRRQVHRRYSRNKDQLYSFMHSVEAEEEQAIREGRGADYGFNDAPFHHYRRDDDEDGEEEGEGDSAGAGSSRFAVPSGQQQQQQRQRSDAGTGTSNVRGDRSSRGAGNDSSTTSASRGAGGGGVDRHEKQAQTARDWVDDNEADRLTEAESEYMRRWRSGASNIHSNNAFNTGTSTPLDRNSSCGGTGSVNQSTGRTAVITLHTSKDYTRRTVQRLQAYVDRLEDTRQRLREALGGSGDDAPTPTTTTHSSVQGGRSSSSNYNGSTMAAGGDKDRTGGRSLSLTSGRYGVPPLYPGSVASGRRPSAGSYFATASTTPRHAGRRIFLSEYDDLEMSATLADLDETDPIDVKIVIEDDGRGSVTRQVVEEPMGSAFTAGGSAPSSIAAAPSSLATPVHRHRRHPSTVAGAAVDCPEEALTPHRTNPKRKASPRHYNTTGVDPTVAGAAEEDRRAHSPLTRENLRGWGDGEGSGGRGRQSGGGPLGAFLHETGQHRGSGAHTPNASTDRPGGRHRHTNASSANSNNPNTSRESVNSTADVATVNASPRKRTATATGTVGASPNASGNRSSLRASSPTFDEAATAEALSSASSSSLSEASSAADAATGSRSHQRNSDNSQEAGPARSTLDNLSGSVSGAGRPRRASALTAVSSDSPQQSQDRRGQRRADGFFSLDGIVVSPSAATTTAAGLGRHWTNSNSNSGGGGGGTAHTPIAIAGGSGAAFPAFGRHGPAVSITTPPHTNGNGSGLGRAGGGAHVVSPSVIPIDRDEELEDPMSGGRSGTGAALSLQLSPSPSSPQLGRQSPGRSITSPTMNSDSNDDGDGIGEGDGPEEPSDLFVAARSASPRSDDSADELTSA